VADSGGVNDANALVASLPPVGVVEETNAITQEHRNDVNLHLVNQTGLQVLLGNVCAAPNIMSLSIAACLARSSAALMPSVTK
jgi:hypothetical protein